MTPRLRNFLYELTMLVLATFIVTSIVLHLANKRIEHQIKEIERMSAPLRSAI